MYDKQLDSGKGTLLHLCDDVIQQEVSFKLEFSLLRYRYYGYNDFIVFGSWFGIWLSILDPNNILRLSNL